jgi:uncharacterized tellurite resistance protein B-like protein
MLSSIRDFFDNNFASPESTARDAHKLELAAATLLAEVVRLDGTISLEERAAVQGVLRERFNLEDKEAATLFQLAEEQSRAATDYYQFTSLIRQHFSQEERQELIELLWRAAYADKALSSHEYQVIRRIADLLYVSQAASMAAKERAKPA